MSKGISMRIAIISDIHEDFINLQLALKTIAELKVDKLICLGDVLGYENSYYKYADTRSARGCFELLKKYSATIVLGNHEIHAIERIPHFYKEIFFPGNWYSIPMNERIRKYEHLFFTYKNEAETGLDEKEYDFIRNLSSWEIIKTNIGDSSFSHFIYPDINGNVTTFYNNRRGFTSHFKWMEGNGINVSFVGHTHIGGVGITSKETLKINKFGRFPIGVSPKIILCPSIARGKIKNGFVIFDDLEKTIEAIQIK